MFGHRGDSSEPGFMPIAHWLGRCHSAGSHFRSCICPGWLGQDPTSIASWPLGDMAAYVRCPRLVPSPSHGYQTPRRLQIHGNKRRTQMRLAAPTYRGLGPKEDGWERFVEFLMTPVRSSRPLPLSRNEKG